MGNKKGSFIKQAGILAAAGIISRIIGILYRSPLTSVIGDEGNGYYQSAYSIYTIVLLLCSYSIPSALSKIIAEKLAQKEYRNVQKIFRCALLYVFVVGGIASIFLLFGAGLFLEGQAAVVLKAFAPTVFISGFVGVLRGYFQAHGSMLQTSISQIIEQLLNAVVSILAAYLLIRATGSTDSTDKAISGAVGSTIGTGSGVLIAFIFMLCAYMLNHGYIKKRTARDQSGKVDSYRQIFGMLLSMVTPIIISTFIYNFNVSFNLVVYTKTMVHFKGFTSAQAATQYGIFSGKSLVILNIPIAIAVAMSSAMIPAIASSRAIGDERATNRRIENAMFVTLLIAIPCAVGLLVLAKPVMQLLFPQKDSLDLASRLLMMTAITVIFDSLSALGNGILQGLGKVKIPVRNAAVALTLQSGILALLLAFTDLNLYALVICLLIYSFTMFFLNTLSVHKYTGLKENVRKLYVWPVLAAFIMGAFAFATYHVIYMLLPRNVIALICAIAVAGIVYFICVIKLKILTEEELDLIPFGGKIVTVAEKMHLM